MALPSSHSSIPSCSSATVGLLLPEAFGLLYSKHELFFQLLIALVRREVQTIKATMEKKQKQKDLYLQFLVTNKQNKHSFLFSGFRNKTEDFLLILSSVIEEFLAADTCSLHFTGKLISHDAAGEDLLNQHFKQCNT